MASKVVLMFQMGQWGWSEVYWNEFDVTDNALISVIGELVGSRLQALPSAARHVATRWSDPAIRGQLRLLPGQGPGTATWSSTVDWAWNAILFREVSTDLSIRGRIFLRPGPETPTTSQVPDPNVVPPAVVASLGQLITRLTFPGTGWRVRGLSSARPSVRIATGGVLGTSANVTTFQPHGIQPGESLRISGTRNQVPGRCLDGLHIASSVPSPTSVTITLPPGPTGTLGAQGFIRGQVYVLQPIFEAAPVRIVQRKTGRPFGLPRGRSSRKVVCCPLPAP